MLGLLTPVKKYLDASKKGKTVSLATLNEDGRPVEFLTVYMSNPLLLNSIIDLGDEKYLKDAMTFMIDQMLLPFTDIELLFLRMLTGKHSEEITVSAHRY